MNMAPEYRHLERATDSGFMGEFFTSRLARLNPEAAGLDSCHILRVFPRHDDSFVIQYELELDIPDEPQAQRTILCGLLDRANSGRGNLPAGYDLERCLTCSEIGLTIPIFPFDPGLPDLAEFWHTGRAGLKLAGIMDAGGVRQFDGEVVAQRLLGYRLERRCTISYLCSRLPGMDDEDSRLSLVVKLAPPRKTARALDALARLERAGLTSTSMDGLTIPAVLGADARQGVVLMEMAPGTSLHEQAGRADFLSACAAAGRILRRLHNLPCLADNSPAHTAAAELADLAVWNRRLCTIFPTCASSVENVYRLLGAHGLSDLPPAEVVPVHRDFYDKQVLYAKGRTTLLDFDNISAGDPAQDVGNFLAHLELRRMQHPETGPAMARGSGAFAESYGRRDEGFARRVEWWRAATFLRLAGLYALRPRWRHLILELAEHSRRHLDMGAPAAKGVES